MNKLHKLLIIALILIMGGNTLKAENLTATRNSETELVTKNQDLHSHDNFITDDNHVVSALAASVAAAADLTVTIDTGGKVTLKDADGDGYYEISTADELYAFAAAVNGGNRAINGKLTANIVVNQNMLTADGKLNGNGSNFRVWIPIGNTTYPYMGAFEGNGNTVSGLYFNNSSSYDIGLFGRVYEVGKVQNVGVVDSYFNGKGTIGGVVGTNYGTVENCYSGTTVGGIDHSIGGVVGSNNPDGTVRNCHSVGSVNSTASYVGGVVGFNHADGIVENCSNTGTISNDGNFVGGVVGDNYGTVQNCYNTGAVSGTGIRVGGVLGINGASGTVTNCYYLNGCAKDGNSVTQFGIGNATAGSTTADEAGKTTAMSSDQFASGEACADLGNHIGLDVANGFCNLCTYQPATLNSDGYYEIFNAGQLYWFANHINTVDRTASAVLTADIDLENRQWIPIGWYDNAEQNLAFAGIFNGNEKTISHLYYNGTDNYFGMFGYSTGEIRDLIIHNSSIHTDSDGRVGMIVGRNAGLIEKCANFGNVSSTGNFVGGICGVVDAGTVRNCYNTGSIKGNYNIGGISGNVQYGGTVENCYSCGSVETSATYTHLGGGITGVLADDVVQPNPSSVINCYHDNMVYSGNTIGNANEGSVINSAGKTTEQFASGEVTYLLQGEQENHIWGQNIDNDETIDAYPVIGGAKVYPISCGGIPYKFSNVEIENLLEHNFENGFCSVCGEMDVPELKDNFYQIGNAGQLFWFANHINTVDRTASAVLTADIDLENRPWTPIGSTGENSNNFRGVFDGQNHTIKGLYVEGGRAGLGFFGEVRTGTVKNFTIYGEVIVNTEVNYVGGVIGSVCGLNSSDHGLERNGATIQNITSYVNLTAKTHGIGMVGGFIGYANHKSLIENCSWYGTFDAGIYRVDSGAGGFIGRIYDSANVTIRNCAAYGTIKTAYKSGTHSNYSTIYIGGFLSYSPSGAQTVMQNNLWAGQIENNTDLTIENAHLSAYGTLNSEVRITNCYADSTLYVTTNNENTNGITTVTAERLASGEIAYLLQGEQKNHIWGQNIDNGEMADAYPVLGGVKVYKHTFDFGNINVYSNLEILDMTPHGKCGDYLYWNITDSTLTIFGTGAMWNYDNYSNKAPWIEYSSILKTLVLEEGMTYIGKSAFRDCSGFTGDLTIPNSVTTIGESAFHWCDGFTGSLTIGNSVTTIGESAFANCSGFTGSLTIGNSVTSIGRTAFHWCDGFTGSLIIPNSVTSIGSSAFEGCSGFTGDLIIGNSVTAIYNYAFRGCSGFTGSLIIPNSVTSVGKYAFYMCYGFTGDLIIGNRVTSIGNGAFCECSGFTGSLIIPNSVTSIGSSAFEGCSGFTEAFFYRNESPSIDLFLFNNVKAKIHAPVIWESFTGIPEDNLVKMPTFVGQQTTDNGQQTSSTGWVFPEGQTEISAEDHVAINAPLFLSQRDNETTSQQVNSLRVKSFGYCGDGTTTNGSITIEEGGQLYCETARGEVTVRKEILGYNSQQDNESTSQQEGETKWYTISSPLKEAIDLSNSNTFITSTPFDLYRYDEPTHTWQNAKPGEGSTNFQTIEPGRGYLYANAKYTTLEFKGNINTEDVNYTLTAQSEVLNGFHLVGNPYTHDISFNHLSAEAELANGYYVLKGEGAWGATLGNEGDVIKVGQGALIKTTDAGTLRISKSQSRSDVESQSRSQQPIANSQQLLNITVSNANYSDKAFVVFDKGVGLDKINHENENIPLLYIPQDGTDYAIAMMDENVNEIPVSFEAMTMGQYTISLQQENCDFDELYLLDKETGEKVNILEEDYTFMATTYDSAERFVLTMNSDNDFDNDTDSDNGNFAYISGEDLIISVEGAVQIIDVMGRIIYSNDVTSDNNRIDVSCFDNAAYVVRVVNEEGVKVQKIIL